MHPLELTGTYKLLAALLVGFLFGFVLLQCGLSNRKTFMDQFSFKDNSFAIIFFISVAIGVPVCYFLTKYGIIKLHPTDYKFWPIVIGALFTGLGLVLCGHIPITAISSFGSGKIYSLWIFIGMLAAFPVINLARPIINDYITNKTDPVDLNLISQNSLFFQGHTAMLYIIPIVCLVLALFLRLIQRSSGAKPSKKKEDSK
ncbi:MAG: YeeE/YedE thiosulfate transporter family protein [Lentisphaerota bacterium]